MLEPQNMRPSGFDQEFCDLTLAMALDALSGSVSFSSTYNYVKSPKEFFYNTVLYLKRTYLPRFLPWPRLYATGHTPLRIYIFY